MAACMEEALHKKLGEIASMVEEEAQRLKAERQAIQAERAAMEEELKLKTEKLEAERAATEEELKSKTAKLEEERATFEAEKDMFTAGSKVVKPKVKLDVGGTIYHASRATLIAVPGSRLEAMFSGHHKLEEDEDGRVFIDRDGATFKRVLEYLRSPTSFSLDGLSKRDAASCEAEFAYYGLPSPGRSPPAPRAPSLSLETNVDPNGLMRALVQSDGQSCTISRESNTGGWAWAVGAEVLADDAVWKLHVNQLNQYPHGYRLMVGIIADPTPSSGNAHNAATFAGWYTANTFHASGSIQASPGWPGWRQHDEAIFKLNALAHTLTVHFKRTGKCYNFSSLPAGNDGQWRFCISMLRSTTVLLSCPSNDERALVH